MQRWSFLLQGEKVNLETLKKNRGLQVALEVENPPANAGDIKDKGLEKKKKKTRVWTLGREDPLEEGMATHSSILAWRIQWPYVDRNITLIIPNDAVLRLGTEIQKS